MPHMAFWYCLHLRPAAVGGTSPAAVGGITHSRRRHHPQPSAASPAAVGGTSPAAVGKTFTGTAGVGKTKTKTKT